MKFYTLLIFSSSFLLCANDEWNRLSLEFQKRGIAKLNDDMKLQSLNRRVRSLYQKLNELFNQNPKMKNLSKSLAGKLGKERDLILKNIDTLQKEILAKDMLLKEEYNEIIAKINDLNDEIYTELMKDPELQELHKKMKALEK